MSRPRVRTTRGGRYGSVSVDMGRHRLTGEAMAELRDLFERAWLATTEEHVFGRRTFTVSRDHAHSGRVSLRLVDRLHADVRELVNDPAYVEYVRLR